MAKKEEVFGICFLEQYLCDASLSTTEKKIVEQTDIIKAMRCSACPAMKLVHPYYNLRSFGGVCLYIYI